ncbi:MAG: sodium-dependent transporter [Prevotella sp.]|jgi:NSS family neurotransmitter:Na+ symporter|nr:sodium-dependent transporter [Prevotella sp.]
MEGRGSFASRIGIVLATAGSAVGLGNIWRFPYMTGQNGGAAFILLYFCCVFLLGIPGMISEFIVGRHGETNAARAYDILSRGKPWKLVGYLGILTSTIILGFYAVVAGWCLEYLFASVMGKIQGDADYVQQYFQTFSSNPIKPCLWAVAFILITHIVVVRGIRNGIERASKLLMPTLLILLVIIVIASCLLPGADKGIEFLLKPDFSKLSGSVFLEALGQAFFSLSLGTACLCTYASYFNKDTYLAGSAVQIALIDSMIAVMAGLMIFPAAFSVGVTPDAGPSLIFITLPNVFQQAFAGIPTIGYAISVMFYALLVFAALTSTISMHEIGTAFFTEELHTRRSRSAWIVTTVCSLIAVFCALSIGACPSIRLLGTDLLDFCDRLTAQYLLPAGAFLTSLFIGWYVPRKVVQEEYTNKGRLRGTFFPVYLFIVRFVCPLCILLVFLHQLGVI